MKQSISFGLKMEYLSMLAMIPGIVIFKTNVLLICLATGLVFQTIAVISHRKDGTIAAFWVRKGPILALSLLFIVGLVAWSHFTRA